MINLSTKWRSWRRVSSQNNPLKSLVLQGIFSIICVWEKSQTKHIRRSSEKYFTRYGSIHGFSVLCSSHFGRSGVWVFFFFSLVSSHFSLRSQRDGSWSWRLACSYFDFVLFVGSLSGCFSFWDFTVSMRGFDISWRNNYENPRPMSHAWIQNLWSLSETFFDTEKMET